MRNKYYALAVQDREASINIYGDITSWEWSESDVSSYTLSKEIEGLDVDVLNVYINSYGGEVAEGLAIYNSLKRHKAKVKTYCDGFACSIASVIFMAGDERFMYETSLLMIHNAWTIAAGNANDFRKQADDLDTITQASIKAYMASVNITEEKLKEMLDAETWLTSNDALEMGFATSIAEDIKTDKVAANARKSLFNLVQSKPKETTGLTELQAKLDEMFDIDLIAEKMVEKIKESISEPQENKTIKFFNALLSERG